MLQSSLLAAYTPPMDFDDQLRRYFSTTDLSTLSNDAVNAGVDRLRVDFGLEKDRGRRFGLWTLMYMLGVAPDLDVAFTDAEDRDAARDFMEMIEEEEEEEHGPPDGTP